MPGTPATMVASRALVTSVRSAWPTAAPSAAIFSRFSACGPLIPTDANDDSTWYSASASESGEKPTWPASARTPVFRPASADFGTPAWVTRVSMDDWKFTAILTDS